jgi:hypothetical protein
MFKNVIQFNTFDNFYQVQRGYISDFEILIYHHDNGFYDSIIGEIPEGNLNVSDILHYLQNHLINIINVSYDKIKIKFIFTTTSSNANHGYMTPWWGGKGLALRAGYSPYPSTKRLRFDLNQEIQALRLTDNAEIYLEFVRMPGLSVNSTCFKNLGLIGASGVNIFDSIQGTTGNPILFTCESGNASTSHYIASTDYNKLPIP